MSRDATGRYSARATQDTACPVCGAPPGVACVVGKTNEPPVEHETHFARTLKSEEDEHNAEIRRRLVEAERKLAVFVEAASRGEINLSPALWRKLMKQ